MNTTSLHPLIEESIINYDWAATQFPDYLKNLSNLAPIVWFGALDNDLPKIITFGSNPSDKEFLDNNHNLLTNPRFPNLHNHPVVVGAGSVNPMTALANYLEEDYNRYFDNRPYWSWFRPIHAFVEVHYSQPLNISYPLPCIQVDALPFATSTKFTELKTEI